MQRVAVFVDAGYLFAQGSVAINGQKVVRSDLALSARAVVEELKDFVDRTTAHCSLLRIYWYDGAPPGTRMSAEQAAIADLDDIKLRLGFINSFGEQKGVDALIVTDMIELARQRAISDAIIVSGDEDIRPGVVIAQNYGVRVHLLGIGRARASQARSLRQECDTTSAWDEQTIAKFLSLRAPAPAIVPVPVVVGADTDQVGATEKAPTSITQDQERAILENAVRSYAETLQIADIASIDAYWKAGSRGFPSDFDRKALGLVGRALGRLADDAEKKMMRSVLRACVQMRLPNGASSE